PETEPDREPPVELPFEWQSRNWADWVYVHRRGLLASVAIYLLLAIGVATMRIPLSSAESQPTLYIDLSELVDLIEEKERLEQLVQDLSQEQQDYYEAIRNMASNADGPLTSESDPSTGPHADVFNEAQELADRMQEARHAYERGLQEAENILQGNRSQDSGASENASEPRGQVSGRVTVSYYLPGRYDNHLAVPAYQCPGGGEVTVNISVNRNGQVVNASVASGSVNDACLREFALKAAQASRFNTDGQAENRQAGTITYLFVPQ
ncbi:MAG: energy transducer TonB, partial [Rikenellaceae bacterium]|nr:energy transducer TonB [Rikenellaceae bacterium]